MTIYANPSEATTQLEAMGIPLEGLQRVVAAAVGGKALTTSFHPSFAGGTYLYHEATAAIRRVLVPLGWEHDEDDQQPRTFSADRQMSIVVQTGDENTGLLGGDEPRARSPKGSATARKIEANRDQLTLFDLGPAHDGNSNGNGMLTWVFLINVEADVARAELSLPRHVLADGRPCDLLHRIILPEYEIGTPVDADATPTPDVEPDVEPDVDVDVAWKQ
ncbi:hypothetical protein [Nocardioides sp. GY 10127]|uniref:hypothetical protein n=1 Tax=Nocardioides sp. GY 10127 TaxID=2569762 RepID=UPI0010A7A0D1|nr:hypothetical protein [Nocardioides sp. GY 10127]TIC86382.1 hypothetical protein E8D37_00240 [Nocardioides sp. GY 10127]